MHLVGPHFTKERAQRELSRETVDVIFEQFFLTKPQQNDILSMLLQVEKIMFSTPHAWKLIMLIEIVNGGGLTEIKMCLFDVMEEYFWQDFLLDGSN